MSAPDYAILTHPQFVPSMYLIPIGWLYVAVMMSVAEATSSNGSVLGAIITFVLYGVLPVALLIYIMGTPARKRALRAREAAEQAARQAASDPPDGSRLAATDPVAPVREEA